MKKRLCIFLICIFLASCQNGAPLEEVEDSNIPKETLRQEQSTMVKEKSIQKLDDALSSKVNVDIEKKEKSGFKKLNYAGSVTRHSGINPIIWNETQELSDKELQIDMLMELKKLYFHKYKGEELKYFSSKDLVYTSDKKVAYREINDGYLFLVTTKNGKLGIRYDKYGREKSKNKNSIYVHSIIFEDLYIYEDVPNYVKLHGENGLIQIADNFVKNAIEDPQLLDALTNIEKKVIAFSNTIDSDTTYFSYLNKRIVKLKIGLIKLKKEPKNTTSTTKKKKIDTKKKKAETIEERKEKLDYKKANYTNIGQFGTKWSGIAERSFCHSGASICYTSKSDALQAKNFYDGVRKGVIDTTDLSFMMRVGREYREFPDRQYTYGTFKYSDKNVLLTITSSKGKILYITFTGYSLPKSEYLEYTFYGVADGDGNHSFYNTYSGIKVEESIVTDFEDNGKFIDHDVQYLYNMFEEAIEKYFSKELGS